MFVPWYERVYLPGQDKAPRDRCYRPPQRSRVSRQASGCGPLRRLPGV